MESLTRLVTESLARHGFDRPLDYRQLRWSRWFRCESHHSLLSIPSKPGVFALAEEIRDLDSTTAYVATAASTVPRSEASGPLSSGPLSNDRPLDCATSHQFSTPRPPEAESRKPEAAKRMLAVSQFFESDDMAFVLDRMLAGRGPMADRLTSGRYFARFVVIEDGSQRRSICNALNQWMISSAETATGIGSHFASSLELTDAIEFIAQPDPAQRNLFGDSHEDASQASSLAGAKSDDPGTSASPSAAATIYARPAASSVAQSPTSQPAAAPQLDSGAASNLHCPTPLPSGF